MTQHNSPDYMHKLMESIDRSAINNAISREDVRVTVSVGFDEDIDLAIAGINHIDSNAHSDRYNQIHEEVRLAAKQAANAKLLEILEKLGAIKD